MTKRGQLPARFPAINEAGQLVSDELSSYRAAAAEQWPLVIGIGLLFGWLLSFPLQGPLLGSLAQQMNFDPQPRVVLFLFGHLSGLASAGMAGYRAPGSLRWFSLAALPCVAISLAAAADIGTLWPALFALMGLLSAFAVIGWGSSFASSLEPDQRGRTFALGAVLANVILLIANLAGRSMEITWLLAFVSLLPVAMPVALIYCRRQRISHNPLSLYRQKPEPLPWRLDAWPMMPFIFTIYVVGGLMYVVGSVAPPPSGPIADYGLLPYILLLFLAGSIADRAGRRAAAFLGAMAVGVGFMSVGLLSGATRYIAIQTLLVGGYAFVDTFVWVSAADLSDRGKATLFYALTLGTNVLAILVGVLLGEEIAAFASGSEVLTISLAGLLALLSLAFVNRLVETRRLDRPVESIPRLSVLPALNAQWCLTPREAEIAGLLIAGVGNRDIRQKLVIAPDTLKTHLRNIYRKAGARNRLELVIMVRDLDGVNGGPERLGGTETVG